MNARLLAVALRARTLKARLAARALADAERMEAAEHAREEARRQGLRAEMRAWHGRAWTLADAPDPAWLEALLARGERSRGELLRAERAVLVARRDNSRAILDRQAVEAARASARSVEAARAEQREQDERDDAARARSRARG